MCISRVLWHLHLSATSRPDGSLVCHFNCRQRVRQRPTAPDKGLTQTKTSIASAATRSTLLDKGSKHWADDASTTCSGQGQETGQNCKLSHEASTARQIDAVTPMPSKPGPNWPARSHGKCCWAKVKFIRETKAIPGYIQSFAAEVFKDND